MPTSSVVAAAAARSHLVDPEHRTAFRAFNGHLEGDARWVVDVYGRSLVLFHHAAPLASDDEEPRAIADQWRTHWPWLRAAVLKERKGETDDARRGRLVDGDAGALDGEIHEHGVRYAVDLLMHHDAGFYLDTRHLRRWLIDHSEGKHVLNTFAYTGSLGVAARAGGAARVLHTDINRRYLDVAEASYALNGFTVDRRDFQPRDFFSFVRGARLRDERFDLVILDPPFFSSTRGGSLDLNRDAPRLVNKVRPLVRSGGTLVVVNNSLFVSGAQFMRELEALCVGGWLAVEAIIGVPEDVAGYPSTRRGGAPVDPAPFAHSTKIVILTVRHR